MINTHKDRLSSLSKIGCATSIISLLLTVIMLIIRYVFILKRFIDDTLKGNKVIDIYCIICQILFECVNYCIKLSHRFVEVLYELSKFYLTFS